MAKVEVNHREVSLQSLLAELIRITNKDDSTFRTDYLRLRLEIVQMALEQNQTLPGTNILLSQVQSLSERDNAWMEDAVNCLTDQIEKAKMKSVMNISELTLPSNFNFYHDTLPSEARLIFSPLSSIHQRLRVIMAEYESPLLNEVLFLSNYMMVTFNTKGTPLMKLLTGMELLLEKMGEWEAYASKRLNSCQDEIMQLKQLIIRYRKIQILSWRNLLNHYRTRMVKNDFENCVRLVHSIEKQIFDSALYRVQASRQKRAANSSKNLVRARNQKQIELEIFEVVDLFIRDSSLGLFESRLGVLTLLFQSLTTKLAKLENSENASELVSVQSYSPEVLVLVKERLTKVLNILHFVLGYYGQFKPKLERTIARLDAAARQKIKTLIDVSKWTVQKFSQVKSNIDKTHRQLHKACKQEEEILMQNIQSLILTSSRKKYIHTDAGGDGLLGLEGQRKDMLVADALKVKAFKVNDAEASQFVKQLDYFEKNQIEPMWPDSGSLEYTMEDLFDRLKLVREVDKKHVQRRALIDLMKFMKNQGLKANF